MKLLVADLLTIAMDALRLAHHVSDSDDIASVHQTVHDLRIRELALHKYEELRHEKTVQHKRE